MERYSNGKGQASVSRIRGCSFASPSRRLWPVSWGSQEVRTGVWREAREGTGGSIKDQGMLICKAFHRSIPGGSGL